MRWIRQQIAEGKLQAGTFLSLGSGVIAELACRAGLDWILIDMEHGFGDFNALDSQIQAARLTNVAPIVRIPLSESALLGRALDLGAAGIMIPQVNTAEQAARAVCAMRYPPDGARGLTRTNRASDFGHDGAYLDAANRDMLTVIQIETKASMEAIDEVAAVDGVDVLFVGPSDLSCNLGVPCQLDHPVLAGCLDKVCATAQKFGKRTGILLKDESLIEPMVRRGFQLVAVHNDLSMIKSAMDRVAGAFSDINHKQK